jgi:phage/plasmid-like protein (TIGR03299 family)
MTALLDSVAYNELEFHPWWRGSALERNAAIRVLRANLPAAEMLKAAGLEWEPIEAALQFEGLLPGDWKKVPQTHYKALVRSDTGALLAVNGARYFIFRNAQLFRLLDALSTVSDLHYFVAGSLDEGRKTFAQVRVGDNFTVNRQSGRKQEFARNMLASTTHDGSGRTRIKNCTTNVCCANTLAMAASEEGAEWSSKHTIRTADFDALVAEAKDALALAEIGWDKQQALYSQLAITPFGRETAREFFAALLTNTTTPEAARLACAKAKEESSRSYTMLERKGKELLELYLTGIDNGGAVKLDALQAVTEYVDHARGRSDDWRSKPENVSAGLNSALFGAGDQLKQQAVSLLATW